MLWACLLLPSLSLDVFARAAPPNARAFVVARLGGASGDEVTVKRLRKRGRDIVLLPENPAFDPIVVDPRTTAFAIEGVGVGLIRSGGW